ncbi:hypothetical protein J437_LFUL006460 [Ladona fulva]|uniref:Major facilitator superfamily (MFS) profile domain-containing protein n=1 Tax=Ladona fulva TaxID=123851 RepID=A0A8K0JY97_LADFU|nr:hypothetical protein J437_LFUL006460 [Ladona fulva]
MQFIKMAANSICRRLALLALCSHRLHSQSQPFRRYCGHGEAPTVRVVPSRFTLLRAREFAWDEYTQQSVVAGYYYGYVTTQLLGGIAAVKWGGKMVVGPAVALTGLFSLVSPVAARQGGEIAFTITRVLQGAASGVVFPAIQSLFSYWFPPNERTKYAALTFASIHLGTVIGMTLSGALLAWYGWPLVFYFFGVIGILFLIPWWYFVYDRPEVHPRISKSEKAFLQESLSVAKTDVGVQVVVPWKSILTSPAVWAITSVHFGYNWVLFTFVSGLPTYMKAILDYDPQKGAFWSSLPYLLQWISSMFCGVFSQWIRRRGYLSHLTTFKIMNGVCEVSSNFTSVNQSLKFHKIYITFFGNFSVLLGSALSLLTITFVGKDYIVILVMFSSYGLLAGAFYGGSYLNHVDISPNYAGILSGINQTFAAASGIAAPLVIGRLTQGMQTISQWDIVFYISIGISLASYVVYLIFGQVKVQPWNMPEPDSNSERDPKSSPNSTEELTKCRY